MNERINELLDEARLTAVQEMFEPELYKFAELIIRECVNEIETYQIPVGNSAAGEMACEWTYDSLKEIRNNIKDKFGIE